MKKDQNEDIERTVIPVAISQLSREVKGMTEDEAVAKIEAAGFKVRIRMVDGVPKMGTCDFWDDRIQLSIKDGKVVGTSVG